MTTEVRIELTDRTDHADRTDARAEPTGAASGSRDGGVFVDVDRDLDGAVPGGVVADTLIDRVRSERAAFVVLNFHDRHTVPSECLRLISALGASPAPVPIVVTEAGVDVRRSLIGTGLLAPSALGDMSSSTVIARRPGRPPLRTPRFR